MSISLTPVTSASSSNYSSSLLSSPQLASDAEAVQTLTRTPSDLLTLSQADFPTNIDQAVQDTIILQNNPNLAQAASGQSGSSGSSSSTSASSLLSSPQLASDAEAVQTLTQTPSDLLSLSQADFPTNIDQAVQDAIILLNNPDLAQAGSAQSGSSGSSSDATALQIIPMLDSCRRQP